MDAVQLMIHSDAMYLSELNTHLDFESFSLTG